MHGNSPVRQNFYMFLVIASNKVHTQSHPETRNHKRYKKNEGSTEFLHEYYEIIAFDPEKRTLLSLSLTR